MVLVWGGGNVRLRISAKLERGREQDFFLLLPHIQEVLLNYLY